MKCLVRECEKPKFRRLWCTTHYKRWIRHGDTSVVIQRTANKGSFKKGEMSEHAHPNWKGENAGYHAKHSWIKRKYGKANMCEHCHIVNAKRYEWANLSGNYVRDITDWKQLCSKCHHKLDDIANRGWCTKKVIQ